MLKVKIHDHVEYISMYDPAIDPEFTTEQRLEYQANFFKKEIEIPVLNPIDEGVTKFYLKSLTVEQKDFYESLLGRDKYVEAKRFVLRYGVEDIVNAYDKDGNFLKVKREKQEFGMGLKNEVVDFFQHFDALRNEIVVAINRL